MPSDAVIFIPMPDYESRLSILKAVLRKTPLAKDVDIAFLAQMTDKFTGADLTEICQRAAKMAIRESIEKTYERVKAREAAGASADAMMEEDNYDVSGDKRPSLGAVAPHVSDASASTPQPLPTLVLQPVPEVKALHFELAMREARRSVSDSDLAKYSAFAASLQQQRAAMGGGQGVSNFKFPRGSAHAEDAAGTQHVDALPAGGADDDLYG